MTCSEWFHYPVLEIATKTAELAALSERGRVLGTQSTHQWMICFVHHHPASFSLRLQAPYTIQVSNSFLFSKLGKASHKT